MHNLLHGPKDWCPRLIYLHVGCHQRIHAFARMNIMLQHQHWQLHMMAASAMLAVGQQPIPEPTHLQLPRQLLPLAST